MSHSLPFYIRHSLGSGSHLSKVWEFFPSCETSDFWWHLWIDFLHDPDCVIMYLPKKCFFLCKNIWYFVSQKQSEPNLCTILLSKNIRVFCWPDPYLPNKILWKFLKIFCLIFGRPNENRAIFVRDIIVKQSNFLEYPIPLDSIAVSVFVFQKQIPMTIWWWDGLACLNSSSSVCHKKADSNLQCPAASRNSGFN